MILEYTPKHFWEYGTMQIHGEAEGNKAISAFTTWEMSFQQLESYDERKSEVAHFLTLSAFFDSANTGESLFRHYWEAEATRGLWTGNLCLGCLVWSRATWRSEYGSGSRTTALC
jgi:hypothetical protein